MASITQNWTGAAPSSAATTSPEMPAFPIVQVLVDQRQNADQRVEAQCVSGYFVCAALAEYDPHVRIEPLA